MKLIFKGWRKFINEQAESLSAPTQRLLPMLINMEKFQSIDDFIGRTQLVQIGSVEDGELKFVLRIDEKVAGTVTYGIIESTDTNTRSACAPDFKSGIEIKATAMLDTIAREGSFKGWGVGRLISFLSTCHLNAQNISVTSDRDTSDKAGEQLVKTLGMLGAEKSEPFDYVGWLIARIKRLYVEDGDVDLYQMVDSTRDSSKRAEKGHNYRRWKFNKENAHRMKAILKNLKPLTPDPSDDCPPSVNVMAGGQYLNDLVYKPELIDVLEKWSTMSSEEVNSILDSDKRVQGYSFVIPKYMVDSAMEIISVINATDKFTEDDISAIDTRSAEVFKDTYDSEIGDRGKAI